MEKFGLYGKFSVKEGEQNTLVNILLEAAESMQNLKDCEIYIVSTSESEPSAVYVFEVWSDQQAHEASLQLEVTQKLIAQAKPIITGMERINTFIPLGGKGTV
jgi:quinol monooxygenase YgiN